MEKTWRRGRRVAIVGGGPGGISAAIAFNAAGYDVKVFERSAKPRPLGGAVMISTPVMEILRSYGIDIVHNFASQTVTNFANHKGRPRVSLPFVKELELASGIPGWHYGILRSTACDKMMEVLNAKAPDTIVGNHALESYEETESGVTLHFTNVESVEADLLVGADGIRSAVSKQAFGEPDLFHVGLRVWLAWCEDVPGVDRDNGWIHHSRNVQASYFPMKHEGKPGFEWWIVERSGPNAPQPTDVEAHMRNLLREFPPVMRQFADRTDFSMNIFPWEIYNRSSLQEWCKGRVACVGDAVHPVSPYAAYGMGMAIEDGYVLARSFHGKDLSDPQVRQAAYAEYQAERVDYCNHNVEFARKLGYAFHRLPRPLSTLRDFAFDHTGILQKFVEKDYRATVSRILRALPELHVG